MGRSTRRSLRSNSSTGRSTRARTASSRSAPPARSPTLTHDEHKRVVEIAIEVAKGRVPVIAGAGSNRTAEAIDLTRHAKEAGADAALIVTPYYNKPTQEGHVPALQGDRRRGRSADHHLQHPAAQRGRHERRDDGAAGEAPEHRRREGRDREPGASAAHAPRLRRRFLPVVRRGSHRACRSSPPAASAASASPPTSRRACCSEMHDRLAGRPRARRRWRSRTAWCRCTTRCSPKPAPAR